MRGRRGRETHLICCCLRSRKARCAARFCAARSACARCVSKALYVDEEEERGDALVCLSSFLAPLEPLPPSSVPLPSPSPTSPNVPPLGLALDSGGLTADGAAPCSVSSLALLARRGRAVPPCCEWRDCGGGGGAGDISSAGGGGGEGESEKGGGSCCAWQRDERASAAYESSSSADERRRGTTLGAAAARAGGVGRCERSWAGERRLPNEGRGPERCCGGGRPGARPVAEDDDDGPAVEGAGAPNAGMRLLVVGRAPLSDREGGGANEGDAEVVEAV